MTISDPLKRFGIPYALFWGTVPLGETEGDCYVLDGGDRVIDLNAVVECLTVEDATGVEPDGGTADPLALLEDDKARGETRTFWHPETQTVASGITHRGLLNICRALVLAFATGELTTRRDREAAIRCAAMLDGFANVGLMALIDEATGCRLP